MVRQSIFVGLCCFEQHMLCVDHWIIGNIDRSDAVFMQDLASLLRADVRFDLVVHVVCE